jgi:hypothetical protein
VIAALASYRFKSTFQECNEESLRRLDFDTYYKANPLTTERWKPRLTVGTMNNQILHFINKGIEAISSPATSDTIIKAFQEDGLLVQMRSPEVIVTLDRIPLDAPRYGLLIPNEVELDLQPSLRVANVTDDLIGEAQGLINSTILDNSDLDDNDTNKLHCT